MENSATKTSVQCSWNGRYEVSMEIRIAIFERKMSKLNIMRIGI